MSEHDVAADAADDMQGPLGGRTRLLLAVLMLVGTVVRIPQLGHGLNDGHPFRQTQTAFVAVEYARHGINLSHTPLPIFGPNSDVPFEFPLPQAVAAVLIRMGASPEFAMRLVGLVAFQAGAILLFLLVFRWHGRLAMLSALALYEFSPFGLAWGASALIDLPAVTLSIGMVVGLDAWFRNGSRIGLASGAISGWLAFLVKITTPPPWCVLIAVSALAAWLTAHSWRRIATGIVASPMLGMVIAVLWTRYADAVKSRHPLTEIMMSKHSTPWNFGTISQRLDPHAYVAAPLRIATEIAGPLGLGLIFAVFGIFAAPTKISRLRSAGWLGTVVVAILVFFNLYYVHSYYLIAVFPAMVAGIGIGIATLARRIRFNTKAAAAAATVFVVVGSARSNDIAQWAVSPPRDAAADRIDAATLPSDLIVLVGCDWNPQTLFFADRRGLMLPYEGSQLAMWKRENINDYHYLFSCDQNIDVTRYLPAGHRVVPTPQTGLWRITAP